MSDQVLHLDFIKLTPETTREQRDHLEAVASELVHIEGVLGLGVIEGEDGSDFDAAFWFLLRDFLALEPFGTHTRYTRFLQGTVAPLISGFAGADVKLGADFMGSDGPAACLALMGPDEAYDFEVEQALEAWAGDTPSAIGLAVGEKQLYRGAAIAFGNSGLERPELPAFRATLIRGTARKLA